MKMNLLLAVMISLFGGSIGRAQIIDSNHRGGTTETVKATAKFPSPSKGRPLNPPFNGLSYEKLVMPKGFFPSRNVPPIKLFSLIGPAALRIGGCTVDQTCWG